MTGIAPRRQRHFSISSRTGSTTVTLGLLVLLFAGASVRYPDFLSGQVILNLFVDNSFLIVLAVGMTFVVLTGGLDLSVGAVVGLTSVVAAVLLRAGWPVPCVLLVMILIGSTMGLLVGLAIHYLDIQPFIATLIAMFLGRGLCYVISPNAISINDPFFLTMAQKQLPVGFGLVISPSVIIAIVVVAIGIFVLHFTRTGRTVYAIGGGGQSAMLMGLSVARTRVLVYVISGFCAALAGILFSFYTLSGDSATGIGLELDAIAAVVIGGTILTGGRGYVLGSLFGVLVLGTIDTIISFDGTLSAWWAQILTGALLLFFVLLQRLVIARKR
ncbi:MAG TPA: galactofuranose ABC transporter, permease protein YjfF [Galbitalea sp.]